MSWGAEKIGAPLKRWARILRRAVGFTLLAAFVGLMFGIFMGTTVGGGVAMYAVFARLM